MMKKWTKQNDNQFGDFSDHFQYGVIKQSDSEYSIGRFVNGEKDGIVIDRNSDGTAYFGKYRKGQKLYPVINLDKKGSLLISLGEDKFGNVYYLTYGASDSSFLYLKREEKGGKNDRGVYYGGLGGEIFFTEYQSTDLNMLDKKFIPDRPIVHNVPFFIPEINDFNKFEFRNDQEHSVCENSLNSRDPGVGIITWKDGSYCVGGWLDNTRNGYQIYQDSTGLDNDDFFFFYGQVNINGLYITTLKGAVYIKCIFSNDDNNDEYKSNSCMLKWCNGVLSYSDIDPEYLLDRKGAGISIPDMDTVEFVQYEGDKINRVEQTFKRQDFKQDASKNKGPEKDDNFLDFTKEDVVAFRAEAVEPKKEVDTEDPEYRLMNLVGQASAKKEFAKIRAYVMKNDASSVYTNMFFTGSQGVGKTTFAKLLASILNKYHAIESDSYYEISARELFSSYDGSSSQLLRDAYSRGRGGVFLIDDARYLGRSNNSGIKELLNTLVNIMNEDKLTTFILVDNKFNISDLYENNKDLLQDKIRFKIDFTDYTREELKEIIRNHAQKKGYTITDEAMQLFIDLIYLSKSYGNEINATAAISILEEIIVNQNVRTSGNEDKEIIIDDVKTYVSENEFTFLDAAGGGQSDARKKLDELIGLEGIKETIDDLIAYFAVNRGKKIDFHMCFSGNPGTGKTEVARILGKLFRQEGILPTHKFVEVTRRDLVAAYIGQSAIKTREVIDKAMGGVLYIDEAYSLSYGDDKDFGREVVAELLKAMEDRRGEFVVILAGYTNEMKKLFDINPGFLSRIKYTLEFPDYSKDEFIQIAKLFLRKEGYTMSDENVNILVDLVLLEKNKPNFANVRTLREYLSKVEIKQASRIRKSKNDENLDEKLLILDDIKAIFGEAVVNEVINGKNEISVPKLDPNKLRELYKSYPLIPFIEHKDLIEEVVVAIRTSGPQSGESSGFFITNDGYIATCAHCVEGSEGIEVRRRINHRGKRIDIIYSADIVSIDSKNDVAVIKVRTKSPEEEFDYVALDDPDHILPPLAEIYEMGYPFGVSRFDEMTVNVGKIGSYQKGRDGEPDQINLDIQAHGGNSGSLIVDAKTSRVIGTLTGASLSPHGQLIETIIFCRPISYIWAMLERDFKKE